MYIKNISYYREASQSDSDESVRIPIRKKAKTGVLRSNKPPRRAHYSHHGVQRYCVIFKKEVIHERKYMLYSTDDFTGMRTKLPIKDGIGGPMGSRTNSMK